MKRLLKIETEHASLKACRRLGRVVEDPNLRGWMAIVAGADRSLAPIVRASLGRARVLVLEGSQGIALVGDPFALYSAGRELQGLDSPELRSVGTWLMKACENADGKPSPMKLGKKLFDWSRPLTMGIVNATPDSFSDGGRSHEQSLAHALKLVDEGADILDVGGESTRPRGASYGEGAKTVSADEETDRVVPLIRALAERCDVPISVDTRKSEVAEAAIEAGAQLVNDVTGLLHDQRIADVCARRGAALCLMHTPADIEALEHEQSSEDVIAQVLEGLESSVSVARKAGMDEGRLLVDPGIGFGKTLAGNFALIRHLEAFAAMGYPVLVGLSRKSCIARAGAAEGREPLALSERVAASVGGAVAAYLRGAHILRVHDVKATVEALRVAAMVRG